MAPSLAPAPARPQSVAPGPGKAATHAVTTAAEELAFRTDQWCKILEAGGPDGISPGFLGAFSIMSWPRSSLTAGSASRSMEAVSTSYGGAQGIWVRERRGRAGGAWYTSTIRSSCVEAPR